MKLRSSRVSNFPNNWHKDIRQSYKTWKEFSYRKRIKYMKKITRHREMPLIPKAIEFPLFHAVALRKKRIILSSQIKANTVLEMI